MVDRQVFKVAHPDFGYVVFTGATVRQQEVLIDYIRIKNKYEYSKKNKTLVHKK